MLGPIILQIVLVLLSAVFVCAETALGAVSETKLEKMIDDGEKRGKGVEKIKWLLDFAKNSARGVSALRIAFTLSLLLGSAYAANIFVAPLTAKISPMINGVGVEIVDKACVLVITLVIAYFSMVIGELVPKRLAIRDPEAVALALCGTIKAVSVVFAPFVWFITVSSNCLLRLFGIDPKENGENVTEEDILNMLDTGSEHGTIDSIENEMIQNVFEFDDTSVSEICTHRRNVTFLYSEDNIETWHNTVVSTRHTYYPICGESEDDVIAVLNIRDFFRMEFADTETAIKEAADKPYFVPENMKADALLTQMKKTRTYFAVVIDEYGGTRGVISLHDVLEILVGKIGDEDEEPIETIKPIEENTWEILGSTPVSDVEKAFDMELGDDSDTFGGYVMGLLGAIPEDGATPSVETEDLKISICLVADHRIEKTVVVRKTQEEKEAEARAESEEKETVEA